MKCPRLYLCLAHFHFISIHQLHPPNVDATNEPTQSWMIWYDLIRIITWPLWSIDLDLARSSPSPRSIGAKPYPSFTASRSIASKSWLALHHCNRSIEPSLVLIFSTLITWFHVISHMQWVPSSHYMSITLTLSYFSIMAHVAHTSVFVWTNHLCI